MLCNLSAYGIKNIPTNADGRWLVVSRGKQGSHRWISLSFCFYHIFVPGTSTLAYAFPVLSCSDFLKVIGMCVAFPCCGALSTLHRQPHSQALLASVLPGMLGCWATAGKPVDRAKGFRPEKENFRCIKGRRDTVLGPGIFQLCQLTPKDPESLLLVQTLSFLRPRGWHFSEEASKCWNAWKKPTCLHVTAWFEVSTLHPKSHSVVGGTTAQFITKWVPS